jgi:hypothetical protein
MPNVPDCAGDYCGQRLDDDANHFGDAAFYCAARGWHVLQAHPRTKQPVLTKWQHAATTNLALIEYWWTINPFCNLGELQAYRRYDSRPF